MFSRSLMWVAVLLWFLLFIPKELTISLFLSRSLSFSFLGKFSNTFFQHSTQNLFLFLFLEDDSRRRQLAIRLETTSIGS